MKPTKPIVSGFSTIELLITTLLGMALAIGSYRFFTGQMKTSVKQAQKSGWSQNSQHARKIIENDIIAAGFDIYNAALKIVPLVSAASDSFTLQSDFNNDGDTSDLNEKILYQFSSGQLTRTLSNNGSPVPVQTLLMDVASFSADFLDGDGKKITDNFACSTRDACNVVHSVRIQWTQSVTGGASAETDFTVFFQNCDNKTGNCRD